MFVKHNLLIDYSFAAAQIIRLVRIARRSASVDRARRSDGRTESGAGTAVGVRRPRTTVGRTGSGGRDPSTYEEKMSAIRTQRMPVHDQ